MNHKFDVDLVVLQSNLLVLTILQIESMDDYMLYSKYVVTLIVTLLIIVHLFGDLLMSALMTITLM
jgi:hypothetical protein